MPKSWLDTLSASARAVYPHARRGVREGISIARIGRAARDGGLSISNAALSEMVRRERAIVSYTSRLYMLGPTRNPDPTKLPEALSRIQSKYSIEVKITSTLSSTGARSEIFATISTDALLNRTQIESGIDKIMSSQGERYGFEMSNYEIVGYMRSGPLGYGL